jgi:hypothetical protein
VVLLCTLNWTRNKHYRLSTVLVEDQLISPFFSGFCQIISMFNFTVDLHLYFPTSNKMAIIGTLPSRFSDKDQQLYKGSLIQACTYKLFIFPSKASRLVTFKIMRHLKG